MNNNFSVLPEDQNMDQSGVDIRNVIDQYSRHWKWFLLSIFLALAFVLYKLNFMRPQYRSSVAIKVKDERSKDDSMLSVFQDLNINNRSASNVEDEIEILKSKGLIGEVIKNLGFNIRFYTQKNKLSEFLDNNLSMETRFYEKENYSNPPLKLNFFISDSAVYKLSAEFIVDVISENSFTYTDVETSLTKKYDFGEKVTNNFGDLIITPNIDLKAFGLIGEKIYVSIGTVQGIARTYSNKISIEPKSEFSSILNISITEGNRRKGEDFLYELIKTYNERTIRLKDELSKSTSDFVTKRLEIISNELSDVDLDAESLKTKYRLSDVASETGLNMQSSQEIERQIVTANTELETIGLVKDFVSDDTNSNEFIPSNIGISDNNVSLSFDQYNQLMLEKKRLLENSTEKNPIVANINEQLRTIKQNINSQLGSLQDAKKISLDALNQQEARINSKLYSAPRQERQIRDVQRQQQIKEALYLYLLQKREETAITLGVSDPNAEIIDMPESTFGPIAPKKKVFYLAALIIGLLIPAVIIFLSDFLNTKIKNKEDLEKILSIPILGDIPKYESKKGYLVSENDNSSVAEAFRIIRTNLNFIVDNSITTGKTIFVTSTIANEGKSFISSNLASSLAFAGKKTLLLGMDIRAPKIKTYLGIRGTKGVTNFIIDTKLNTKEITVSVPKIKNLDLISSGDIAPNPAELLMNYRVKELFEQVKSQYDYIIVDTAASSIITDTMLLRDYADAFIYVIRANFLDKRQLGYLKAVHRDKRFPNLALLINAVDPKKGYGYGYGYGSEFEKKNKQKQWWNLANLWRT
ncbi:MAG: polysaccharide biosynthesis tyrosine autokinase [Flavobacteriaceae bacterium]|nr:polysaccharide biosynthesis tyrosine autokinase [Flavobacteriaceae bacterium]